MSKPKTPVPLKAKLATVSTGILVTTVVVFSVYCQTPACIVPDADNNLWGLTSLVVLALAVFILYYGWKPDKKS